MKIALIACCLGMLCLAATTAARAGPIINPLFDGDFDGWSGETIDEDNGTLSVAPDASPQFEILGDGMARLSTDPASPNTFGVFLFQDFDLPILATTIAIEYSWQLSKVTGLSPDIAGILLFNIDDPADEALLLDATTSTGSGALLSDISGFAGKAVELLFVLADGGDDIADSFSFGKITINAQSVATPAPLGLIGLGVMLLWPRLTERSRERTDGHRGRPIDAAKSAGRFTWHAGRPGL